jgi:hypothetical protein
MNMKMFPTNGHLLKFKPTGEILHWQPTNKVVLPSDEAEVFNVPE